MPSVLISSRIASPRVFVSISHRCAPPSTYVVICVCDCVIDRPCVCTRDDDRKPEVADDGDPELYPHQPRRYPRRLGFAVVGDGPRAQ